MHPVEFQRKWIGVSLKERSAAQEHFVDLCRVLGQPTPAEADPDGRFYCFEKGASKAGGGEGWADVWYDGHFGWEYKGKHANLDAAYLQLLRYKDDLNNPPLLIVSDLNRILIHTNFTGTVKTVHAIDLANFADASSQRILHQVFADPDALKPAVTVATVTEEAARRFGQIALGLDARGVEPLRAAHFLVQLLFCLFAEDTALLPKAIFSRLLDLGVKRPDLFHAQVVELLDAMRDGGVAGYEVIPHFNGGLFVRVDPPELTAGEIGILRDAAALDWSQIEPSIFGTLFERSLDPARRAQLGAHYTSRADIERVVDPVVMTPLRRRWDEVRARAGTLKAQWDAAADPSTRTRRRGAFAACLQDFQDELKAVRVLDPACGSGNFLYVALSRLLDLEKEALAWFATNGLTMGYPQVGPGQVMGLEVNEYARELAQVAIWIGYLQWMRANGFGGISEPVLASLETIRLQDALLDRSDPDHPREATWPAADYIIGNPPFVGRKELRGKLGNRYVDDLFMVFSGKVSRTSNFCCYFFEKARHQIEVGGSKRAGLLATENIRFQDSRDVLERIKRSGDIFLAWSDEPWLLDGASVRISIIGFDDGSEIERFLDGQSVIEINSDLTSALDVSGAQHLAENGGLSFMGLTLSGPFDISQDLAHVMLSQPANVNGRPNSDVVRRFFNGQDLTGRPRNRWVIDFGTDMPLSRAAQYEMPFQHVQEFVLPIRRSNTREAYREKWWLHAEARSGMRRAMQPLCRYLATVLVSKHRFFVWLDRDVEPANRLIVFARDDDYFFGVLGSRAHEVWALRMGARHGGERPTYNNSTCFETFPLPWPPGSEPADDSRVAAIAAAAKRLDELRRAWLNPPDASEAELKKRTLTNLYNARPAWLAHAHAALDRAVWAAYGWDDPDPAAVPEDDILGRLLALNLARAAALTPSPSPRIGRGGHELAG